MEKTYKKINIKKITDNICIPILLEQQFNDIGIFNSAPKIKSEWETPVFINDSINLNNQLVNKIMGIYPLDKLRLIDKEITPSKNIEDFYKQGGVITCTAESRLKDLEQRLENNRYIIGLKLNEESYMNYKDETVSSFNVLKSIEGDTYNYVIDGIFNYITEGVDEFSEVTYNSEGWNKLNVSFDALYKKDYLFGYINEGNINSDVFIDRGNVSVNDYHLPLIEIDNLDKLIQYNGNFYNILR